MIFFNLWALRVRKAPTSQKSHSGPSGPKCPGECPTVSPKMGVSEGVPWGVSGPFGPRAPECQKGVPRVSKRCPDTLRTLSGHLFDTPWPGARRALETPRRTLPRTPPFSGTPRRTLSRTLRARRALMTLLAGRGFPNLKVFPRDPDILKTVCVSEFATHSDSLLQIVNHCA